MFMKINICGHFELVDSRLLFLNKKKQWINLPIKIICELNVIKLYVVIELRLLNHEYQLFQISWLNKCILIVQLSCISLKRF